MEMKFSEPKCEEEEGGALATQGWEPGDLLAVDGVLLQEEEMWLNFLHFQQREGSRH
jgi:hypothetical protein